MNPIHDQEHALYRFFDAEDVLLYVGLTVRLPTRLRDHHRGKAWWDEVARMTVQRYPSRPQVVEAERLAIMTEHPKYNVQHARRGSASVDIGSEPPGHIAEFDWSHLLRFPFMAMIDAISVMGNASYEALSDDQWDQVVVDAKIAAAFGDNCDGCRAMGIPLEQRLRYPYRAEHGEHGVNMHYQCQVCGHRWFSGYPNAPREQWP